MEKQYVVNRKEKEQTLIMAISALFELETFQCKNQGQCPSIPLKEINYNRIALEAIIKRIRNELGYL